MIKDIKSYVEYFTTVDKPIRYKELYLYPFKLKDYYEMLEAMEILSIEKNKISDINIIKMSYLQYITTVLFYDKTIKENNKYTEGEKWQYKFFLLMGETFNCEPYDINVLVNNKGKVFLKIKNVEISSKEFDEIKEIILFSNFINYDNRYVSPEVQEVRDTYIRLKCKDERTPPLEERIMFVMKNTGMFKKDILDMTYRDFSILYGLCIDEIEYKINKTAELTGNVKFKQPIKHFMYGKKEDIYDQIFNDVEETKRQFGQ